jgi:hypothetical protein
MDSGPAPSGASRNDNRWGVRIRGRFGIRIGRTICNDPLVQTITRSPWRCNFGRTANIATRICRRIPRKRASVLTNAPSARTAPRAGSTMCAQTAVAVLSRGRSGRQKNGGPACPSKSIHRQPSACISPLVSTISPRIRRGSGTFRRRSADALHVVIPGWCVSTRPGISRFRVRCFASPRNDNYPAATIVPSTSPKPTR